MGNVCTSCLLILLIGLSTETVRSNLSMFFWGPRCEVDVSRLPLNERQLYTHVLDPGKGKLVFLVTQRPCWGVSITDADKPTLAIQEERDAVMEKFVRAFFFFFFLEK